MSYWIPVFYRLPDEEEIVIASTEGDVYPEAKFTKQCGWLWKADAISDYWSSLDGVIAWMPLPDPYTGWR